MTAPLQLAPHMEPEGLACLEQFVRGVQCYLEYGSGGSTVHVAKVIQVPTIISVESDKLWIEKIREAIGPTVASCSWSIVTSARWASGVTQKIETKSATIGVMPRFLGK